MRAIAILLLLVAQLALAEKNKFYYMKSLCKSHFLQQLYKKLDGGVIWSKNERNLDCIITFQTQSILQRFMLHFDLLQLDCNDHLLVYDGAHAGNQPKVDLSCRYTKESVGAIFTRSNFVTLKYVTDNWGTDANGFKLVITSVKDPKHGCKDFRCVKKEYCISADLQCDGVDHCTDGSDEDQTLCYNDSTSHILSTQTTWIIVGAIVILLLLIAAISIVVCVCPKRRRTPSYISSQVDQMMERNGGSKGIVSQHELMEAVAVTRLPPGNWRHPAGPRGYSARRPRLLRTPAAR